MFCSKVAVQVDLFRPPGTNEYTKHVSKSLETVSVSVSPTQNSCIGNSLGNPFPNSVGSQCKSRNCRQKLTIHVPGRTVAILDRMCGDALFAAELLSSSSSSSSSSESNFGLFLLSCTVLREEDFRVADAEKKISRI